MKYDFDRKVDRKATNDMKWHAKAVSSYLQRPVPEEMIPMWLADTDFAFAPVILDAFVRLWKVSIKQYVTGRKCALTGM